MALTVTLDKDGNHYLGSMRMVVATVDLDSSYPSGGYSLTPAMLGLVTIKHMDTQHRSGVSLDYDFSSNKLRCFVPAVSVGALGAATLDDAPISSVGGTTTRSIGIDNGGASSTIRFGVQAEVAASANLSTITGARIVAFGY